MTWLLALLAIELALTHHAVWKVHPLPHILFINSDCGTLTVEMLFRDSWPLVQLLLWGK